MLTRRFWRSLSLEDAPWPVRFGVVYLIMLFLAVNVALVALTATLIWSFLQ